MTATLVSAAYAVFAHLNAEKASLYRAVLGVLVVADALLEDLDTKRSIAG